MDCARLIDLAAFVITLSSLLFYLSFEGYFEKGGWFLRNGKEFTWMGEAVMTLAFELYIVLLLSYFVVGVSCFVLYKGCAYML